MRAVVVDDETHNRENIQELLRNYAPEVIVIAEAENAEEGIKQIKKHQPDLVFLDIQLGNQSAFELLKQLDEITFEIIFITAYDKYGIQAIKFAALDYLLKPVDVEELQTAVKKAHDKILQKNKDERLEYLLGYLKSHSNIHSKIALPLFNEILYVSIDDIIRCEANNTYTFFFLTTGERVLVSKTLKEYAEILKDYGFIRTHQSHMVNARYIKSWLKEDGGVLLLKNLTKIPVSKPNREKVKTTLGLQIR
jgi:two-component system LytT family response regulator